MDAPYFAYGSNMNLDQMAGRGPGATLLGLARWPGWRLLINSRGYVTACEEAGAEILGCLWEVTDAHWVALDRYEGVSSGFYGHVDCLLESIPAEGSVSAVAYLATDSSPGAPSALYLDAVTHGADQIGLPDEYVASIEAWRNGPPTS